MRRLWECKLLHNVRVHEVVEEFKMILLRILIFFDGLDKLSLHYVH
jgi:hypothetical protein